MIKLVRRIKSFPLLLSYSKASPAHIPPRNIHTMYIHTYLANPACRIVCPSSRMNKPALDGSFLPLYIHLIHDSHSVSGDKSQRIKTGFSNSPFSFHKLCSCTRMETNVFHDSYSSSQPARSHHQNLLVTFHFILFFDNIMLSTGLKDREERRKLHPPGTLFLTGWSVQFSQYRRKLFDTFDLIRTTFMALVGQKSSVGHRYSNLCTRIARWFFVMSLFHRIVWSWWTYFLFDGIQALV